MKGDPFEILGRIPKGRTYQWVTESVLGDKEIAEDTLLTLLDSGWKAVPRRRHPRMKGVGRKIVVNGQILMEKDSVRADAARAAEVKAARKQYDDHPAARDAADRWSTNRVWSTFATVQGPYPLAAAGPTTVEVTLPLRLSQKLVEAAAICAIPVEEYARRMIALMLCRTLSGVLQPTLERDAWEVRQLTTEESP